MDSVRIVNAAEVDPSSVKDKIATTASQRFVELFPGLFFDYQVFDASALQRDLARVERFYRGKGYFDVLVRAGRILRTAPNHVRVEIVVDEGTPMRNRNVAVEGLDGLPPELAAGVRRQAASSLPKGARFDEEDYKKAQTAILRSLTDRGFAYATARASATADVAAHVVDYTFNVKPGLPATFGSVTIEGLDPDAGGPRPQEISETPLLRVMGIKPGTPFSSAKLDSATQSLLDLGVFSAAHIVPKLADPPGPVVPLTVQVEPSKLRTLRLGGGFEFDEIKTELHLLIGWEDRNFFGDLRDFSIEAKPGVVLYPFRVGDLNTLTNVLPEERLTLSLEQPGFIDPRTTGFIRPGFNIYPLLVEPNPKPDLSQPVVGYVEPKGEVGVRRGFGEHFNVSLAENIQGEIPFAYTNSIGEPLPNILLSYPQLITTLDYRDDPVHPHSGFYLTNDLQVAGGPFGGNATDLRIAPEARGYIPIARNVTLALRGTLGFLFAKNYGGYVQSGQTVGTGLSNAVNAAIDRDIELTYFRGFFSGGPSSDRGYPLHGIAPFGVVPFLSPARATQQAGLGCDPTVNPNYRTDPDCSEPLGGFTQWETSVELRFQTGGPLGFAVFCDTADVSAKEADIRLTHIHLSCGFGGRYDTPVGPIRLDLGYRIQPLQVLGYPNEAAVFKADPSNGQPPTIFNQYLSFAFGIGESF